MVLPERLLCLDPLSGLALPPTQCPNLINCIDCPVTLGQTGPGCFSSSCSLQVPLTGQKYPRLPPSPCSPVITQKSHPGPSFSAPLPRAGHCGSASKLPRPCIRQIQPKSSRAWKTLWPVLRCSIVLDSAWMVGRADGVSALGHSLQVFSAGGVPTRGGRPRGRWLDVIHHPAPLPRNARLLWPRVRPGPASLPSPATWWAAGEGSGCRLQAALCLLPLPWAGWACGDWRLP